MTTTKEQQTSATAGKYLTFAVASERYGLAILNVQEIIKVTNITLVPRCPEYVKGVINLRGKIIPVIDLRKKFGIESIPYDDKTCIIVIHIRNEEQKFLAGIIVDTVLEVIHFSEQEIEPAPNYGSQVDSNFIVGMANHDRQLNILIDIEKALSNSEGSNLKALGHDSVAT